MSGEREWGERVGERGRGWERVGERGWEREKIQSHEQVHPGRKSTAERVEDRERVGGREGESARRSQPPNEAVLGDKLNQENERNREREDSLCVLGKVTGKMKVTSNEPCAFWRSAPSWRGWERERERVRG